MAASGKEKGNNLTSVDRRAQVRSLAADMFFRRGYESTTMREIANALDIKVASLYYHFPDKEQILFELIDSVVGQLVHGLKEVIRREAAPEMRLAGVVANHVVMHAMRPRESTLGDSELRSLTGERLAASVGNRDEYERLVIKVLRDGSRSGAFDLVDAKLTAYALIAQSSHVGTWYRPDARLSLTQVVEVYVLLAFRMVNAKPVSSEDIGRLVDEVRALHEALL